MQRDRLLAIGSWAVLCAAVCAIAACGGGSQNEGETVPVSANNQPPSPNDPSPGDPPLPPSVPPLAQVTVTPESANIAAGGSFQFAANVTPLDAVTWSVSGDGCAVDDCGSVDANGRYTAPVRVPTTATITVSATSTSDPTRSGTGVVAIGPQLAGTFIRTGDMTAAREGHTATLLLDGRVLIAGGAGYTAELYDPASGAFAQTGVMREQRYYATATLLANGQVLIVGGDLSGTAELYDPATGTFVRTGAMLRATEWVITATLLDNGKVLVQSDMDFELYDPATGRFQAAAIPASGGFWPTGTLLADGTVLFVGENPAQLYDPARDAFSNVAGSLAAVGLGYLYQHSATRLADGRVLVAGGYNEDFPGGRVSSAELYDPAARLFRRTGSLLSARASHTAVLLADGQVLIVGGESVRCVGDECFWAVGLASAELYAASTGSFAAVGSMNVARAAPRTALLKNGDVLITGGYDYSCSMEGCDFETIASAEIYRPR